MLDIHKTQVPQIGGPKAFITLIPLGGQVLSKAIAGDKLPWKNAQKRLKKNITSVEIKSIKAILLLYCTALVWKSDSNATLKNHSKSIKDKVKKLKIKT